MKTKYSKSYILYIMVFSVLFAIFRIISYGNPEYCFDEYIDFSYGDIDFMHPNSINYNIVNWLITYLGYILFFGNYLEEMFISNASMLIFRSKKRGKLLISYYLELFIYVIAGFMIQFILGYGFKAVTSGNYIISMSTMMNMIIVVLFCFNSVLIVNCMSLYLNAKYCVLSIMIIYIASVKFILFLLDGYQEYIKYIYVSTTIFSLDYFDVHINEIFSIIYNLVICVGVIIINGFLFKNKDIL